MIVNRVSRVSPFPLTIFVPDQEETSPPPLVNSKAIDSLSDRVIERTLEIPSAFVSSSYRRREREKSFERSRFRFPPLLRATPTKPLNNGQVFEKEELVLESSKRRSLERSDSNRNPAAVGRKAERESAEERRERERENTRGIEYDTRELRAGETGRAN